MARQVVMEVEFGSTPSANRLYDLEKQWYGPGNAKVSKDFSEDRYFVYIFGGMEEGKEELYSTEDLTAWLMGVLGTDEDWSLNDVWEEGLMD